MTSVAQHYGRGSPRAAAMRRSIPDDEISSGTDTDEDGALIEKARQAAEQKRAPPKKRGPTSMLHPTVNVCLRTHTTPGHGAVAHQAAA